MGQASPVLRRTTRGFSHWCPGCEEMHHINVGVTDGPNWSFDSNVERPTFNPSVRITGKQTIKVEGKWTGEWVRDQDGRALDMCCHYFLNAGELRFCSDSTHGLSGKNVPLPELPPNCRDG